ncbi:hypothetical protein HW49_01775 [Porphyromonadaceae bacterium COT-184 OH4590]|nr:hypothetical protein HW49_01775 [Porphyromonadaceae bacterium COT-184 OH4590]
MKKIFFGLILGVLVAFSSCANLLVSEPRGSSASEKQVNSSIRELEARLLGLYRNNNSGSPNTQAELIGGQKFIDMYLDLLTSDIAVTASNYGWAAGYSDMLAFYATSEENNWLWRYEYNNIRNVNLLIKRCNELLATGNESIKTSVEHALGQAYAFRGFFYSNLLNVYANSENVVSNKPIMPYYDESNMGEIQGLSSYSFVVDKVITDFDRAIGLLASFKRNSKGIIDANVAKILKAYVHINKGRAFDITSTAQECAKALSLAEEVIASNQYTILPHAQLLTNGFNSTESSNWMWGINVTAETTLAINSFWSWIDIYTYSYASAGDILAIDRGIYDSFNTMLSPTDERKKWWNPQYKYAPTNKFFSPSKPIIQGDRNWLNDLVLMRIEEAYLIASEAAFALGDEAKAKTYLKTLIEQRDPGHVANIDALTGDDLRNYIASNWRIEMWAEGKSFMAFKRFGWTHTRGENHFYNKGATLNVSDKYFTFELPSAEDNYNPNVGN